MKTDQRVLRASSLVIGGGIAGLTSAIKLASKGSVILISKGPLVEANTYYAQGGIASVLSREDSFEDHIRDTIVAGAGLCNPDIVKLVVEDGPRSIQELISWGVSFDLNQNRDHDDYHLTREGGHSHRRVIHAKDFTGRALMETLIGTVQKNTNITVMENQFAIDLITSDKYCPDFSGNHCYGAYVLDRTSEEIYRIIAGRTILATGGHGRIYLYTTNPDLATGDGVAMAWRAGCKAANLEFMQFHPTCLYHPKAKDFLISEAVRGEGGVLRDRFGRSFMESYHAMGSLAPRDVVARAIDRELKRSGDLCMYLDVTHLGESKIKSHFPSIYERCLSLGIDISKEMIPVVPAAHYNCGGVIVDRNARTSIKGLYAVGEVACTGLHGANRLASNSLLEALVFADRMASASEQDGLVNTASEIPDWDYGTVVPSDEQVVLSQTWDEIRRVMWNYVGIVRTNKRLERALTRISAIRKELHEYYWSYKINDKLLEVRNLAEVAYLTIRSAKLRKESRGIHYNLDHPESNRQAKDSIIW